MTFVYLLVIIIRMLGIFMVLSVFSSAALNLKGSTPILAGIAYGIYAIMQATFLLPMGWLSDRLGRKPVMLAGLALFTVGSLGCAMAETIWQMMAFRALQGTGAISGVALAQIAELTPERQRSTAYALVGLAVGSSFIVGLFAGSFLNEIGGLELIFIVLSTLGAIAFLLVALTKPHPNARNSAPQLTYTYRLWEALAMGGLYSFALQMTVFLFPLIFDTLIPSKKLSLQIGYLIILAPSVLSYPLVRIITARRGPRICIGAGVAVGLGGLVLSLFSGGFITLLLAGVALFILGYSIAQPCIMAIASEVSPAKGRTLSLYQLTTIGAGGIGAVVGGWGWPRFGVKVLWIGFLALLALLTFTFILDTWRQARLK